MTPGQHERPLRSQLGLDVGGGGPQLLFDEFRKLGLMLSWLFFCVIIFDCAFL